MAHGRSQPPRARQNRRWEDWLDVRDLPLVTRCPAMPQARYRRDDRFRVMFSAMVTDADATKKKYKEIGWELRVGWLSNTEERLASELPIEQDMAKNRN